MATTTTFTTMINTPQPKKAGPPVPPRPQQSSLLKQQQQRDVSSSSSSNATATAATSSSSSSTSQRLMSKVGLEQPQILKKPIITNANSNSKSNTATVSLNSTSVTTSGGRTVIYKSPSLNLQKRQEDREKRNEASTQTAISAITRTTSAAATTTAAKAKLTNGTQAPKPPLKLRKAPDVPTNFKPRIITPEVEKTEIKSSDNLNQNVNSSNNNNNSNNGNNIVIVHSLQGVVTLNRHHSMGAGSPQNKPLIKDTRLSLGKVDFERVGKIQVQQLQPTTQPLPKPRKIVKLPVATLDVEDTSSSTTTSSSSSNTLHVNSLFKRSKTSIENFTSRSNITTVNTSGTGSYLSGKTVEIKNNLKNAAERLFSEIMVNQQKQNALETTNTIITKHERAIQHQAEPMMAMNNANNANNITVVTTSKDYASVNNDNNNCTRINIITNNNNSSSNNTNAPTTNNQIRKVVSAFNSPEKKSAAFHEMLISELAAMRTRSCSMENLQTTKQFLQQPPQSPQSVKESIIDKEFQNYKQFKTLENQLKANKIQQDQQQQKQKSTTPPLLNNKHHNHQHHHPQTPDDDIDADNIEDADGDVEEDLKKSLKVIAAQNTPRKRTPSGCSSDSSPYGTERSARIRTSDWIEVGDNGKQVTLTSCHISLEDSGLEDEERMDEMSSSGVGDSWDSVKEAEQQQQQQLQLQQQQQQAKRNRNVKRIMSINDLPPLPKSLSGINKMLASDSGLVSDVDTEIKNTKNNDFKQYENQKENNNNLNINHNNNNNNNNNNNSLKDTSDKLNNASLTTNTIATTSMLSTATTPLKEINGNETISEIPPAIPGSKLDTQIATLRKEMFGLRQLDLSLLSQLWALNDSIQEFRTMIQEQEQDDDETYSTHSRSPSPYDSVSSDADDEILTLKSKNRMELQNGNVITTQPKLTTKMYATDNDLINHITNSSSSSSTSTTVTPSTISATVAEQQQKSQLMKPPLPKPLDVKPVPRMRSAPPPPPTHRKSQTAPPRPT
ncbi:uncharacterized protein ACRADG_012909 isoform 1-T2 [Cochliomyia hominivorax]